MISLSKVSLLTLIGPEFNKSDSINIILKADIYELLLRKEIKGVLETQLIMQNVALG
jgi:hypothetical protein